MPDAQPGGQVPELQVTRMVTLMCFCCDHRNPVGAKFCNACGTPLHLKPCKHCEAINVRAAAHCHGCGEAFALDFPSLDEAPLLLDAPGAAEASAPAEATFDAAYSPSPRRLVAKRAAVLLLGMTATALLSAYYAYRQPGIGPHAAGDADSSQLTRAAVATDGRPEPTPAPMSARMAPGSSTESTAAAVAPANGPRVAVGEAEVVPATRADTNRVAPLEAPKPRAAAAPSAKRSVGANTAKPKAAGRVARPTRTEPVAAAQPSIGRQIEEPPPPDRGPIALQQAVAVPPVRSVAPDPPPVQRPEESARRPTPASGGWDRPCAEGVALDASCDVRMMPKGN